MNVVNVKKNFNKSKNKLALAGVCRFDSKSNDLLQITDLLIGCITYDLKLEYDIVSGSKYKIQLSDYLKSKYGIISFKDGFSNYNTKIFVEKIVANEKGPSS